MAKEKLEKLITQIVVREITKHVMEQLAISQKKVLVVCTGAKLGLENWITSLKELEQDGFSFDLLVSNNAGQILDIEELGNRLSFGKIWREEIILSQDEFVNNYSTVLVPALTINSAAKIVNCTTDTLASQTVFTALMKRCRVIIAVDGCCPDNAERRRMGHQPIEPLREKLRENITSLKNYGAHLTTSSKLRDATLKFFEKSVGTLEDQQNKERLVKTQKISCEKKLISRKDIIYLPEKSQLTVSQKSLITDLARDTARTRSITIRRE